MALQEEPKHVCCYKWFNYLLIVITQENVLVDCTIIYILSIIEHSEDVSLETPLFL